MRVGLFIPCYVDQLYPQIGIATYQLLTRMGCDVVYPDEQTCCGQPMANAGFAHLTKGCDENFVRQFKEFDYIVSPSGSCVLHIKEHLGGPDSIRSAVYELCEFLVDVLNIEDTGACFPYVVGLHLSCHGQRGLGLSSTSELHEKPYSKLERLLINVKGLSLMKTKRWDECCGFGGTFCVTEESISVQMGKDRIDEHAARGVQYITSADASCLMHLEGILKRARSPIKVKHIAEILAEATIHVN